MRRLGGDDIPRSLTRGGARGVPNLLPGWPEDGTAMRLCFRLASGLEKEEEEEG